MKTKDSRETDRAFSTLNTKKNQPKKPWVGKETESTGKYGEFCHAEGIQTHSEMSQTKAAFAEFTQPSLKNKLYCYVEFCRWKRNHKMSNFVANLNYKKMLDGLDTKECQDLRLSVHSVKQKYRRTNIKIGHIVRISTHDLPFRKCYKTQLTEDVSKKIAISSRKPPTYTIKGKQDEIIRGKLNKKSRWQSFN